MAIFGNPATNQTQELYGEVEIGAVVTPYIVNFWYAGILLLFALSSTLINPVVYLYYTKQRPSEATFLFRLLSLLNLITNILKPGLVSVKLVMPGFQPEYRPASIWESAHSAIHSTVYFTSVFVTILLAVSRALKTKNPFIQLPTKHFVMAILVYTPLTSCLINYCIFLSDRVFVSKSQRVQSLKLLLNQTVSLHTVLSLTVHLALCGATLYLLGMTVYLLNYSREAARIKSSSKRGVFLILAINFTSFIFLFLSQIGIIFRFHFGHGHIPWFYENLALVVNLVLPVALAGLNPLLVVACNKNVRKLLRGILCQGKCQIETALTRAQPVQRYMNARRDDTGV